ncbi:phosphohydrolase [Sphingobium sp. 22B]|uniref:metallophosphoesterase n=1 Tax=unclassified Sphingobium TaxID=2611147 RepID=UPI000785183C|nr:MULTISPECIES: metallophosphoesterase [unclassified Sphingobium]KXU30746.1 phosphohydrolase [Sphingobium sp. AM]KYC30630.1 phosphohydrolase [Sphingobium sp. 22B]OAP30351.1 phosphohydrolase [Sphingobium sp. 20006FA]
MTGLLRRRRWLAALLLILLAVPGGAVWLYANARAMPVVRRLDVALPFPADAPRRPVTVALLTDSHLSGPDNSPERMARIVALVNGLRPELIVLGGDYIGDDKGGATYDPAQSIAPFAALHAPLGVVAVLGNHDARKHTGISRRQWGDLFGRIGIRLLDNQAVRRGPLAIGGLRDIYTGRPDIPGTLAAMQALGGAPLMLSHGPDAFPLLPDRAMLTLVGHTHCGQVALPFAGIVYVPSRYGTRYACGVYREGRRTMVVSAGLGTSGLPIRMLAPPDVWLITIHPR